MDIEDLSTQLTEYVCDKLCKYPCDGLSAEQLEHKCECCKVLELTAKICDLRKE